MNARNQEPSGFGDHDEPAMPPLMRVEEIIRDSLATCSKAPHPSAPGAAHVMLVYLRAIETELYEARDLLAQERGCK
jgi:hypothetical protein